MNLPKLISAPLPWLTLLGGRIFRRSPTTSYPSFELSRTLRFTKDGWRFVLLLLVIGISAINTGNNLLYLVVATLLSLIIISGILSELVLQNLHIKRELPAVIHKNSVVPVRISVENRKGLVASYSFWVEELPQEGLECEPLYIVKLEAGGKKEGIARYTFTRRGRMKLSGIVVATRFPFGFFVKMRRLPSAQEVVVYPAIVEAGLPEVNPAGEHGATSTHDRGTGDEIRGLEDYTLLDDAKFIHWKASARAGRLIKKEFETEKTKRVSIVFENRGREDETFEAMVDRAASLANHYLKSGYEVALKTLTRSVEYGRGIQQLHRIMEVLAEIAPVDRKGGPSVRVEP